MPHASHDPATWEVDRKSSSLFTKSAVVHRGAQPLTANPQGTSRFLLTDTRNTFMSHFDTSRGEKWLVAMELEPLRLACLQDSQTSPVPMQSQNTTWDHLPRICGRGTRLPSTKEKNPIPVPCSLPSGACTAYSFAAKHMFPAGKTHGTGERECV